MMGKYATIHRQEGGKKALHTESQSSKFATASNKAESAAASPGMFQLITLSSCHSFCARQRVHLFFS